MTEVLSGTTGETSIIGTRVPKFCRVCGSRLVSDSSVTGYDPYTGDALEDNNLRCNNPTITTRLGVRSVIQHPRWTEYEDIWSEN